MRCHYLGPEAGRQKDHRYGYPYRGLRSSSRQNYTGAFTNSQDFLQELEKYSQKTGEKLWQLPIDEDFHKQVLESNVADMNNCVIGVGAGSSLAAAFLEEFVDEGVEWIHLDIAGSSDFSEGKPYMAKGATGVLVRTLGEMFQ